jgi:hypothetical protein
MNGSKKRVLCLCILTLGWTACAQSNEVLVKVLSAAKKPVAGTIYFSPGEKVVGKTTVAGEYRLKHSCEIGHTFKAVPADRSEYYDSKPVPCNTVVELLVMPRPPEVASAWGSVHFDQITPAKFSPKSTHVFAGVYGGIVASQKDVEPEDSMSPTKCQVTLSRKYDVGYVDASQNAWRKVQIDGARPSVPVAAETKHFFPTTCKEAQPKILELEKGATRELDAKFRQYYQLNSGKIESAVNAQIKVGKP